MIDELADVIDGIEPRAIGVLRLENEIQVSFSDIKVIPV